MATRTHDPTPEKWARLKYAVIAPLLVSPPEQGALGAALAELAAKVYRHPEKKRGCIRFGKSTIERWYYLARDAADPLAALRRKPRSDAGRNRVFSGPLLTALEQQYRQHPRWSYQLHWDNLAALVESRSKLGPMVSYSTLQRRMKAHGWLPKKRLPKHATPGQREAYDRLEQLEVRSYERETVHGLWHSDFHVGYLRVVDREARLHKPVMLAVLDDRSRVCCHAQWYLAESAENFIHGLCQALAKRGLPRELMTDRGGAMLADETQNGLDRLGIRHQPTLPYSPYQNGKQECFWGQVDGRLLAMLEDVEGLTLAMLNRATQAWVEGEYNRKAHTELGCTPLVRLQQGPDVSRPAPGAQALRLAFSLREFRTLRRSDGTVSIQGKRFELPSRYRHLSKVVVRYQSFDLSHVWLADERTGESFCRLLPQDKARNADGHRRSLAPLSAPHSSEPAAPAEPIPPLLRKLMDEYAATGLPPAYLPKDELENEEENNE